MLTTLHAFCATPIAVALMVAHAQVGLAQQDDRALYAVDADGTNLRELARFPGFEIINSPEISPDGQWVGVDGWTREQNLRDAHLLFVHIETGEVRDLGAGAMPSWSADGNWFAFSHYEPRGVSVQSFDGLQTLLVDEDGWGIQWAPDGMKAVYTLAERGGTQLVIYEFVGRSRRHVFAQNDIPYSSIYWNCKWSPDSRQVCIKGRRRDGGEEIAVVDVADGSARVEVLCGAADFLPDIGWHPDGSRITLPGRDGQIYVVDSVGGQVPQLLPGQPEDRHNSGNCWTPDGKSLIFISSAR